MTGTTDDRDESGQATPGGHAAARLREQLARELGDVPAENPPDATASGEPEADQKADTQEAPEAGPDHDTDDGPDDGDGSG